MRREMIALQICCVKCGKILGYYEGEEFYIHSEDGFYRNDLEVWCVDCQKEEA